MYQMRFLEHISFRFYSRFGAERRTYFNLNPLMNKHLSLLIAALVTPLLAAEPLEIWISSQQDKAYYETMVETYQETHKDFDANVTAYGFQELPEKLGFALKSGQGIPDVVQIDEALFGAFLADAPPFVDITKRVKTAGLDKSLVSSRLNLFSHKGKNYGLPQSLSAYVLYYRKDLFATYGLKPADLKTWDDATRIGRDLALDHQVSLLSMDPSYFDVLLRQKGSDLFNKKGEPLPDFEMAVELLEWMVKTNKEGIAALPERGSIFDPLYFSSQVANGEVLTIMGAGWFGLDMMPQFADDLSGKWGIMPLPVWKEGGPRTSCFAGQGLMMVQGTKQEEAAWGFLEWVMTDTKANVERFTMGNSFPAFKPVWTDPRMLAPNEYFGTESLGKVLIDISGDVPEVVMHPKRPMALFMMQEQFFSAAMYEVEPARTLLENLRSALKE